MNRTAALALACLCVEASAAGSPAQVWSVAPSAMSTSSWSQSLAVDFAGDVFVVGRGSNASNQYCMVTRKFLGTTGAQAWSRETCGAVVNGQGDRQGIAVDSQGNVVVGGSVGGAARAVKFAGATGATLWDRSFTTPEDPTITVLGMDLDGAGNAVVAASATLGGRPAAKIIKYAGDDGRTLWEYATQDLEHNIAAFAVARDGSVVFSTLMRTLGYSWFVAKLAPDGGLRWGRGAPYGDGAPTDVAVDAAGDVYVAGPTSNHGIGDAVGVAKMDSIGGGTLWTRTFDSSKDDFVGKMRLSPEGDPLIAGTVAGQFVTRLSRTDGSVLWQHFVPDDYGGTIWPYDVIVDSRDNVIVAAEERITESGSTTTKLRTTALDYATGQVRWGLREPSQSTSGTKNAVSTSSAIILLDGSLGAPVRLARLDPASERAQINVQGLWWRSSESGWGVNFAQQGDLLFVTWFTYDVDGGPIWFVMSDAHREADGLYRGRIARVTGPPFNAARFDPALVRASDVGEGRILFTDDANGEFAYSIGDTQIRKAITRMVYATPAPACSPSTGPHFANYQDLWWAAPAGSESGWGINFTHQKDILFATWFTYRADGQPTWLVASNLTRDAGESFSGPVARTTGPSYRQITFNPATVRSEVVGSMKVAFQDPEHGVLEYTVDGVSQSKPIVRLIVATPPTVCH